MDISWQTLNNEVLWLIFTAIDKKSDLVQLQQVCKHWSYLAYRRLYHTACIDETPFLTPYARALEHSAYQPRYLVMVIDLGNKFPSHHYTKSKKYKQFIHTVARLCPNIVQIKAGLKAPSKSFYRDVLSLHQQGYFQHLECLPDFSYVDAYECELEYYNLVAVLKATLTRVSIAKNPFSEVLNSQSVTNKWEQHLKEFPRLKELVISYRHYGFFYEADAFLEKCIAPVVNIYAHVHGYGGPESVPLNLVTTRQQPQVKHLNLNMASFGEMDLDYIIHKFTGLETFTFRNIREQRISPMLFFSDSGDADLVRLCTRMFHFLVSMKRFEASKLWFESFHIEAFSFWAQHSQLKALTISKCSLYETEVAYMTVLSRDKEAGFKLTDFEDIKDGAYEMEFCLNNLNFALHYGQVLQLFKGSTIEALCLRDVITMGSEDTQDEQLGFVDNSLGYVIDHYTAIKDIQIHNANCHTLNAKTVGKQLQKLTFKQCSIKPRVLQQLSLSVERIQKLILNEVAMVNADQQDHSLVIDMPQTAIDDLKIINFAASMYLIKLCVSEPSPVPQFLQIQADDVAYLDQDTFESMCLTSKHDYYCLMVHINCKTFKRLALPDKCFSSISE